MNTKIYRIFNRPVHSFLLFIQTAAGPGEDDHIFVVKDELLPGEESASSEEPEESSEVPEEMEGESESSSDSSVEESLTYARCNGQPGIPELLQAPANITAEVLKVTIAGKPDAYCYELDSPVPIALQPDESITILAAYATCKQCLGTVLGGEGEVPEEPVETELPSAFDLPINPNRVLYTIASLSDMDFYPSTSPGEDMLYRASNVALLFRSEKSMEVTLDEIVKDIIKNARLQGIVSPAFEIFTAEDNTILPLSNDDDDYLFTP